MSITQQAIGAGDVVSVSGRRLGEAPRIGEIVDVLGEAGHEHYAVRWEDGHESILYPGETTSISPRRRRQPEAPAPTAGLLATLRDLRIEAELLHHRRTLSAASEARSLKIAPELVAKTVIARDEDGVHVRAVVPASASLDVAKLASALGVTGLQILTEEELLVAYPQFELGAVPPFGGPAGDTVVLDRGLALVDRVVFEGGAHDCSIRMRPEDLVTIADARVANIAN